MCFFKKIKICLKKYLCCIEEQHRRGYYYKFSQNSGSVSYDNN